MHVFWEPIVEPLLGLLDPRVIIEIGSDHGLNTRNLLGFSDHNGGTVHVIDPLPKFDVDEWLLQYPKTLVFHEVPSLEVLGSIESADIVLIDGDHNWHTVYHELKLIEGMAGGDSNRFPTILLHDVGWPYARRDLYYEPDRIPSPDRHPFRRLGIRPGRGDLDPVGGFNPHLFNAMQEGGRRNGVLTAIEDFIHEASFEVAFVVVPGINDLGILYPTSLRSRRPSAAEFIEDLAKVPALLQILEQVEALRIESQIEALDSNVELNELRLVLGQQESQSADSDRQREVAMSQVIRLKAELERADSDLTAAREELAVSVEQLAEADRTYKQLRARRSVRMVLTLAKLAKPFFDLSRKPGYSPFGEIAQRRLVRRITAQRPGSQSVGGPLVSIVILTRNGARHLNRLLPKLEKNTRYRSFEVVVVDNGSEDGTTAILKIPRNFPLKVIRNNWNASFSGGNNQGVEIADGELLLFLNNDIEPINPGWLGAMVEAIQVDDATVAAGAELIYPVRGDRASDLTVQHTGIRFDFREQAAYAANISAPDPLASRLAGIAEVPAATAAALMIKAEAFRSVGGFDDAYVYGTEDVDLCLRLRDLGKVVVTGQAVMFHHESATQAQIAPDVTYVNRLRNRQRFAEVWAPRLTRSMRREQLDTGSSAWTLRKGKTVAITITNRDSSQAFGDYYTAHELGDAFTSCGWNVVYAERYQDHWYEIEEGVDLLISLLDSFDVRRAPEGAFTIAWVRNWVDRWMGTPWFEDYNLVVASSYNAADVISLGSRFVPAVIPLATNLERFQSGLPNPSFESDYVFVGNHWGLGRRLVDLLDVRPDERFMLFGKGWEQDPRVARFWRGHLDYELLPEVYRSTKVVLDDTATHARPYAFVNSRVFDALAAGALVLTDNLEGSVEMFDGLLPTFSNGEELRILLDKYLSDDQERSQLVEKLGEAVASHYSYANRPTEFLELALADVERPRAAIKIAVPNDEIKASWGDTHFASGLAHALTSLGMPTEVHILPEWDSPKNQAVDVVIHLRGLTSYTPKPAHINVLWIISHPDDVYPRECEKYDLVLVASRSHAEWLQSRISVPVVFMPQATDERRFHPTPSRPDLATEVLFVGNSRGQQRLAVDCAINSLLPLTVYGGGWNGLIPTRFVRADYFPNEDLGGLYASAKVVLNDHWPDMRESGFISNRVFDALASGAVVVSDRAVGLDELFGALVPTFSNAKELKDTVGSLLEDVDRRKDISRLATTLVAKEHTFSRRGEQLVALLGPLLAERQKDLEGIVFGTSALKTD